MQNVDPITVHWFHFRRGLICLTAREPKATGHSCFTSIRFFFFFFFLFFVVSFNQGCKVPRKIIKWFLAVKRNFQISRSLHQGSYKTTTKYSRKTETERGDDLMFIECIMTLFTTLQRPERCGLFCYSVGSQCSATLIFCTNWFVRQLHNTNTSIAERQKYFSWHYYLIIEEQKS